MNVSSYKNMKACEIILNSHGAKKQLLKTIEELGELSRALSRTLLLIDSVEKNGSMVNGNADLDNLNEEIADVTIMLNQVRIWIDNEDVIIDKLIAQKLDRELNRIEGMNTPLKEAEPEPNEIDLSQIEDLMPLEEEVKNDE